MTEASAGGVRHGAARHGIVVGVDGSDQSLCALSWAAREAQLRRTPLHVITAYTIPVFAASSMDAGYATLDDQVIREGAEAVLEQAVARLADYDVEIHPSVETGDAAGVLLDLSEEAELLVVGSRGRGGFVGRLLGSVSGAVPAHAKCPSVTVPLACAPRLGQTDLEVPRGKQPPVGPEGEERVVLVGADGSEQARTAMLVAAEQAQRWGYPLRVVCALPPFTGSLAWVPAPLDREALYAELMEQLDAGTAWLRSHFPGLPISGEVLEGSPIELLIEATRTAALLVLGTRGRGGFAGMLLGSTSQGVLHHAKGPVMVVPDTKDPRLEDRRKFGSMPEDAT
ncbi:universal stress protein [Arthrobacter sp. I2-34]|uniref:Universal stress protein n=1 Tax=Arthrobacter hankyongi TaxID=2904801 RepID=A0ABS9LD69_9MICC|nr:universal stress protein [Arthrobacter hankyongi]MCG2624605.1 universal stress protein [Arthrobacter hankyongi]